MDPVKTPEEQVKALGDEALIEQHLDVESDLNELIALIALLGEKADAWEQTPELTRRRFQKELPQVVARGDGLGRTIGRRSAIAPELIQQARDAWLAVRRRVTELG